MGVMDGNLVFILQCTHGIFQYFNRQKRRFSGDSYAENTIILKGEVSLSVCRPGGVFFPGVVNNKKSSFDFDSHR